MKTNNNIQNDIDAIFDSVNSIKDVHVSPFFKDRAMQRLFAEKQVNQSRVWSWFSPQFQLATLMVFLILNVFAITKLDSNATSDEIDEFAETYSLIASEYESIFN
ncbi:hypothetical protein [Psychroserpens sp.]|uniref:hypothetical protein n=1 Tax=Psychroserpens sp. TaxID=2020870 RepID=UPI002B271AA4|nr:hypothetical protein [Psychroserpens sp.]